MTKIANKVTAGWPIPADVKESFTKFCAEKGNLAQEDCAGALVIWQYLPAQIREYARLTAKGKPAVDADFWEQFSKGLELGIKAQLNSRSQKPAKE